ncbi:MAG: N-acetyl-gamma-glutamyl-phosphate reductase [Lachnospiraceae bacterium]|nr:N-acetyl-gamma-glutamyl-phosphate reductase [Lachnospiraceae bacterium]
MCIQKKKIFIDGSEGTTGLRIFERFENRDDIELLKIPSESRKDPAAVRQFIHDSDITFLCLPDAASREAAALAADEDVILIDTSTAHRTEPGWAYGYPELSEKHREAIRTGRRIAVPGCHATGFITLVYPLIANGLLAPACPVSAFSLTGYSGGGKKMIAEYEGADRDEELLSPRQYGLSQMHKHLKEMKAVTGLAREPLFSPIVADYYSGMLVSVPLYADMLNGTQTPESIHGMFEEHFAGEPFVTVMPFGAEADCRNFLGSNNRSGWDGIEIFVTGNEDRILLSSRFDNLGKGASGAAVQCLNIVLGCSETKGLNL